ncbi:MAG TPA: hypothetical protein VHB79_38775 [Polyangiaceae bacterium]|nr:hypothetical protein [Polyangiaceae bacterium]
MPVEYSQVELLAKRLGGYLGATLALELSFRDLKALREAVAPFEREEGLIEQRARSVEDVASAGDRYLAVHNDEGRRQVVFELAAALSAIPAFEDAIGELAAVPFEGDLSWLEARLKTYHPDPKGRDGAKGAATILAELIVLDVEGSALGLGVAEEEDLEDAIERARKALDKAVRKVFEDVQTGENEA